MFMQEARRSRAGDLDPQPGVHLGRNRLDRARALLRETESRLAAAGDVHAGQAPPSRQHACSVQEEHAPPMHPPMHSPMHSAIPPFAMNGLCSDEFELLRRFEQGGVHEIGASAIRPAGVDARPRFDVVPHACLIFVANWLLNADDQAPSQALGDQVADGPFCCVAWIGDRVHPDPRSLEMEAAIRWQHLHGVGAQRNRDALLRHSIFIRDSERAFAPVRHGHLSRNACRGVGGQARSGTVRRLQMDACACNRLWCAEQAVRMGAAQVVIVDGTGFSALAWRRLQLAVDAAGTQSQMRETMHGQTAKPCVLVVTSSPDGRQSAGCAATARWSVGLAAPDSECAMGGDAAFGWRLRLMSARQFGLQGVLAGGTAGGTAETQARIDARDRVDQGSAMHSASERGCIDIVMSRSAAGTRADAAWELVGARARMHADRGVLATLVLDNLDAEPTLAAESAMQMACLDGGTQSWRARSA